MAPGADPGRIRLAYRGAEVQLTPHGQLDVSTPFGGFQDAQPFAYQDIEGERVEVKADFALQDEPDGSSQAVRFELGAYDSSQPLVIDPSLVVYAGYIGGDAIDGASDVAVDSEGSAYVTGFTSSSHMSFPVTAGPDTTFNADQDVFVAKVNADGTALIYAGYIGGSGSETGNGIAVDADGNAYVTGSTESTASSFPVAAGPDLTYNGGATDSFIAKVNATGTGLVYAGYIGGSESDAASGVEVDAEGNAYVAGDTSSPADSFPVGTGPDLTFNGGRDAFVSKVNPAGTALVYSGYVGGAGFEFGRAIALDGDGNVYVVGETSSNEETFLATVGPDLTFNGGARDAFIAKVGSSGAALEYAGYIGGAGLDFGHGVAVDAAGRAYVTGVTSSEEDSFPVAVGPDLTYNGGARDGFIARVTSDGTALTYAGYIGGAGVDQANAVAVDSGGSAHVAGFTGSTEASFPVGGGPDLTFNGARDAFVARVHSSGTSLIHASYVGGEGDDRAWGIAVDGDGLIYVVGETVSTEDSFPVTVGPDVTFNGLSDAFVAKLDISVPSISAGGIVNAASFLGGPIAPGEIISIFGANIGPEEGVGTQLDESGRIATELAGTQVLFDGEPVPLFFVREDQVNTQATYRLDGLTSTEVQIIYQGEASNVITVPVAPSAPGFFTLPDDRDQVIVILPDGSLNSAANPAQPGDTVVMYLTGEGQTVPAGEDGKLAEAPFPKPILPVEVVIGGLPAKLLYFGAAPGFAGLVQINAEIPEGLGTAALTPEGVAIGGNAVPVSAGVGDQNSQDGATIAVGEPDGGPTNVLPVANPLSVMTDEDTPVTLSLSGSDGDGDPLTISIVLHPANGSLAGLTQMPPGSASVTYTPEPDFFGPDTVRFKVTDPFGEMATAEVKITVKPVDDPPIANDDTITTAKNKPATGKVLANDSDPDGDPLVIKAVTQGSNGSVTTNGQTVTYKPNKDFTGSDSFTYTNSDGNSTDTATVNVSVLKEPLMADLSIDKAVTLGDFEAGQQATYTLTITNSGTADATDATVNDTIPAPLTLVSATPSQGNPCTGDPAVTCNLGTILAGQSAIVTIVVNIPSSATGVVSNTATVTSPDDQVAGNNSDTDVTTILSNVDLSISKTDGLTTVVAGTQLTYTITAANAGPQDSNGAMISDTIPIELVSLSLVSCMPLGGATCDPGLPLSGNNFNAAVNIPVSGSVAYQISGTVDPSASGTLANTATVTPAAGSTEVNPGDESATDNDTAITKEADLSIVKTGPTTATAGGTLTYTVTVTNDGPSNACNVVVTDNVPVPSAGGSLTFKPAPDSSAECSEGAGVVTCSLAGLPAAAGSNTKVYILAFDVSPNAMGTIDNSASVAADEPDPAAGNNAAAAPQATIAKEADLSITKSDSPDPVIAGGGNTIIYTVTVNNAGPSDASGVVVTDTLPAGVTFVSTSGCTEDPAGVPACTLGTITAGSSAMYTITATVDPSTSGTITNNASVVGNETDPNGANDMVMEDTTVNANVDMGITKTDGLTTVVAGTPLTYTITVSNAGPSDAVGATVSDTFPATLTGVTWTCTPAGAGSSCTNAAGAGNLSETVSVGVGGTVTFSVTGTVDPGAMGTISNTAAVTPPASATETNPGNENATDADTVITKEADLSITKTAGSVVAGSQVTYTITASNIGPSDAVGATVTDTFPASLSNVMWTCMAGASSSCPANGNGNLNQMVDIAAGESAIFTVTGDLASDAMGNLVNTANIAPPAGVTDPNVGNDSATDNTPIDKEAELTITKSDNNDPVIAGSGAITYTVTVNNAGPSDASDVVVTDTLPGDVTLVSTAGDCSEPTGVPTCTLDTIAASSSKQFTINVTVDSTATGTLTNNAMVATSTPLGAGSVTNVDEMTTVNTEATITVTKDDGVASLNPGSPPTYTIMISNAGPSDLTGATVSDMFPAAITSTSTTSVAAGCATGNTAGPFAGNINDTVTIPPGGSITYTVVAQTDPAATGSLANTVNVTGGAMTVLGTTSATDTDTLTPSGNLSITKGDDFDPILTGNVLTYTIVVSNSGPSTAPGVTVTDAFPAEFTNPTWTCVAAGAGSSCAAMGAGNLAAESVNIGPGGMVTFTVTGTISTAVATQITNTASLAVPAGFTDSDGVGNNMVMETTNLTVNDPPMASTAGSSTVGVVGEVLTLMGSNSTDDGLPAPPAMLTFDWTFTLVPAGSAITTGSTFSMLADTMFTPDVAGTYMATLTVDDSAANNQAMLTVTVSAASTTTEITSDSPDPSALNAAYTVSGTVTANAPSGAMVNEGMVDVSDGTGGTCMASVTAGAFNCMVTSATAGAKTLTATYNGTTNFNGSGPSAGVAHTVNMGTTTTSVDSSSPTPSIFPAAFQVNFTVTGTPASPGPTGNVTVSLSGGGMCMGTVAVGSCMLTPAMTGMQTLTATYPGDSDYQGSADATGIPHTVSPAPMAVADNFDIVGNTPFEHAGTQTISEGLFFAGNVLSNDIGLGIMVISASPITTALGASVTINAAGEFIYDGNAACGPGDTNMSDTFMYTITGGTMATVTLDCDEQVWWVKNNDAGGNAGTHANPFQTLAQADGVVNSNSGAGDTIFVYEGDGTTTGQNSGITLLNAQRLFGEGIALTIDSTLNMLAGPHTLTAVGTHPLIDNTGGGNDVDVVSSGADLGGVEIQGLQFVGSVHGINVSASATDDVGVLIANNIIGTTGGSASGPTMNGLNAVSTSSGDLEIAFNNNTVNTVGVHGVNVNNSGLTGEVFLTSFEGNTFVGVSGSAGVTGSAVVMNTVVFDADPSDADFTGDTVPAGGNAIGSSGVPVGGAGMVLASVSGDVDFGLASGVLDIFATTTGLQAFGTGAINAAAGLGFMITVPDGSVINSSVGVAIDLDPLTGVFGTSGGSQVTISGQSASFTDVAGMLFFSPSSALTGGSNDVFSMTNSLTNSTADITYAGTVVDNSGTGITLAANGAGGSASFTGTVDLGTTSALTNAALEMTGNNTTFAANFADLDIVTSGADGIFGTADGTLTTAAGSTVNTTNGTAINITGLDFGGASLNFSNVDQTGTGNGINLASITGTVNLGAVTINATGGGLFASTAGTATVNSTSGTIAAGNVGISASGPTMTLGLMLTSMGVTGGTHGIFLNSTAGSLVVGAGGTITGTSVAGVEIDGSTGTVMIGSNISTSSGRPVIVENLVGTDIDFTGTVAAPAGSGILIQNNTSAIAKTIDFTAQTTLSTGANDGVELINNDTATITFNGGLAIGTTSGTGFSATSGGTVNVSGSSNTVTSTSGQAVDIDNMTTGITFSSVSSTSSGDHGIDLTNLAASSSFNGGTTTVTSATNESINIVTVASGSDIDFGTTGIVTRGTTGVFIDSITGGTVGFGTITDANGSNATGYGIRIEDSSAAVTIAAANISNTNQGTATADGDSNGVPNNDGDGDAIFLKNNTGSFTLNGGTLQNLETDGIDCRGCSNITLNNVTIDEIDVSNTSGNVNPTNDNGIFALNITGTNLIQGGTISDFDTNGVSGDDDSGIKILNIGTSLTEFRVDGVSFTNPGVTLGGNRGFEFTARGAVNGNVVVEDCIMTGLRGDGIGISNGNSTGSGTLDVSIARNTLQNSTVTGAFGGIQIGVIGTAVMNLGIHGNTLNNLYPSNANNGVVGITVQEDGNLFAVIDDNDISNSGVAGVSGGRVGVFMTAGNTGTASDDPDNFDVTITENDFSNIDDEGILIHVRGSALNAGNNGQVRIVDNRIGDDGAGGLQPVGNGGFDMGMTLRIDNFAKTVNVLMDGNRIRNFSDGTGDETLDFDVEDNATANATVTSNFFTSTTSNPTNQVIFDAEQSTATLNLDFQSNTTSEGAGSGNGSVFFDNSAAATFNANTSGNSPAPTTTGTIGSIGSATLPTSSIVAGKDSVSQVATVSTAFGNSLSVTARNADGSAANGVTVTFAAPGAGASGTFPSGSTCVTNASGVCSVPFTANATAGAYEVTASATVSSTAISEKFFLRNTP